MLLCRISPTKRNRIQGLSVGVMFLMQLFLMDQAIAQLSGEICLTSKNTVNNVYGLDDIPETRMPRIQKIIDAVDRPFSGQIISGRYRGRPIDLNIVEGDTQMWFKLMVDVRGGGLVDHFGDQEVLVHLCEKDGRYYVKKATTGEEVDIDVGLDASGNINRVDATVSGHTARVTPQLSAGTQTAQQWSPRTQNGTIN